jgi:hypothetical protein
VVERSSQAVFVAAGRSIAHHLRPRVSAGESLASSRSDVCSQLGLLFSAKSC